MGKKNHEQRCAHSCAGCEGCDEEVFEEEGCKNILAWLSGPRKKPAQQEQPPAQSTSDIELSIFQE